MAQGVSCSLPCKVGGATEPDAVIGEHAAHPRDGADPHRLTRAARCAAGQRQLGFAGGDPKTAIPQPAEIHPVAAVEVEQVGACGQPGREGDVRRSRVGGMGGIWGDGVSGCHSDGLGPRRLQGALP